MNRDDAVVILSNHRDEIRQCFSVKSIAVFGSTARNEARTDSDVDVLVEFDPDAEIGLFDFIRLQWVLEELLDNKVDLVTRSGLIPQLRDVVLKEAVYVS